MTSRDAIADLRRIAFLLERANEATYRVRAFRSAANALAGLPDREIAARAAAGTLTDLAGVGDVTARCVAESLRGEQPVYLRRLTVTADTDLEEAAAALRTALRDDCHVHSNWSDGGSPIEEMALAAVELGHEYVVLTDHSPRLTVARGLKAERLRRQLDYVAACNEALPAGFRILTGIEVDILEDGCTGRMVASRPAGVTGPGDRGHRRRSRPPSEFDGEAVFAACAEHDKAVEVNSRPERQDPPKRLLRLALEAGCVFAIDTDAHAPGQLDWQRFGCERAALCGVPPEQVVNTWPAAQLVEWAASHGT